MADERLKMMEKPVNKYRDLGPLLIKLEGAVVGTSTGRSPRMHSYYLYWEKLIYNSLLKVRPSQQTLCPCLWCLLCHLF